VIINIKKSPINNPLNKQKNKTPVTKLIIIIFKYSPIKINANIPALYSVLNPETNSLSPSLKSKGVRFVSASLLVNQKTIKGKILKTKKEFLFMCICLNSRTENLNTADNKINTILTS